MHVCWSYKNRSNLDSGGSSVAMVYEPMEGQRTHIMQFSQGLHSTLIFSVSAILYSNKYDQTKVKDNKMSRFHKYNTE